MNDFDYDVAQKKRIAAGARHRRRGSKSRYCGLPHDNMTQKEWKSMNGNVNTYNLRAPMSWSQFKRLPEDLKHKYIEWLVDTYGITQSLLADGFDAKISAVSEYFRIHNLNRLFKRGRRVTEEQVRLFTKFWNGEINDNSVIEEKAHPVPDDTPNVVPNSIPTITQKKSITPLSSAVTLNFKGIPDMREVETLLRLAFGQNGDGVRIKIEAEFHEGWEKEATDAG